MSEAPGGTEGARAEPGSAAGAGAAGRPGEGGGAAVVADLEAQLAEARDLRLRALADADNARKRCADQVRRAAEEARAQVARQWLPVLDNLERALAHADAEPSSIIEGIQAIRLQALQVLAKLGFSRRDDTGAMFDPARHDAVASRAVPDAAPGTVVEVMQPAYGDGDHQLRPAQVVVAVAE
ncbi:MAG TPA: nucleotide exchange factor GrpE [Streptosporangiaceae bacterium]|jgi:molecular chaperone GrpE|nr:nucleotide exchange factor GrpE [Streptosporangiaceae bacterium]